MRIGLLCHGFLGWGGGLDFIRGIVGSLLAQDKEVELHLLLPTNGPRQKIIELVRSLDTMRRFFVGSTERSVGVSPNRALVCEFVDSFGSDVVVHHIDSGSRAIRSAVARLALDVVLPSISALSQHPRCPWIGYVADLQDYHFPHFFSPKDLEIRRKRTISIVNSADVVIVNARAVISDIERFIPSHTSKLVALPFSAAPSRQWLDLDDGVDTGYEIEGRYFIICNQFWLHKDHLTAFRAFSEVLQKYPDIQLVCTGETQDYRRPEYFSSLMEESSRLGISKSLRVLGMIPKRSQIALLKRSLALVQPTLFEGGPGGGAVFDSVSLGVPAIASDIPVNLELENENVCFFRAGDFYSLAEEMRRRVELGYLQRPSITELERAGRERRAACGRRLVETIGELLQK